MTSSRSLRCDRRASGFSRIHATASVTLSRAINAPAVSNDSQLAALTASATNDVPATSHARSMRSRRPTAAATRTMTRTSSRSPLKSSRYCTTPGRCPKGPEASVAASPSVATDRR